ncbi:DUF58 domain-containing protein [Taibaiella helva]|uniref:DUF58 domain-containing protein n=1 Tax=Taibaiella helva TaxID=2301235 RepID=UPI000E5767A5|nr:DUF58 domain-containing protein [Taibaiella helva]
MTTIPQQSAIENLELIARQVVEGFIIGLHKSPFHGFSVEFAEHRLYNQGDNLKYVDWKVYGRNDKMFVKKFEEETNLRCCIAIDTSASMFFPETGATKLQYSGVAAACLLYLFKKQLDAGALAFFDEELYSLTQARSGSRHYRMLITELEQLLHQPNRGRKTNAPAALHQIAERLHQRSLVIVFSDMPGSPEKGAELFSALQHLRHSKHEVILFHVIDGHQELEFNYDNRPYEFVDMETNETLKINPSDIKEEYLSRLNAYRKTLEAHCLQYRIDLVTCDMREPVEAVLHRYLLKRNKMM